MDHVTKATPASGMVQRLTVDIACTHTKLDDSSLVVPEICDGCEILECSTVRRPDHAHSGDSCHLKVSTSRGQTVHKI